MADDQIEIAGEAWGGSLDGKLNFGHARQENEDVALCGMAGFFDGFEHVGDVVLRACAWGFVAVFERERVDGRVDVEDVAGGQIGFDGLGIEGCTHENDAHGVIGMALQVAAHGEGHVGLKGALVEFVEDDGVDGFEKRVAAQVLQEHACGEEGEFCVLACAFIEPDVIADVLSRRFAEFAGDACGCGQAGQPPRFGAQDFPLC